ncbi:hypothetical protein RB195_018909 [Necator americanus]|uniref:Mos1 transposase HTH domain-containing protein n=1 Tax=Necator americanus TaxID=51031 RepID=A0ABR1CDD5_NECAM
MRLENHTHIRHIMLYHYEKGWTAAQSLRDVNELFGKGTITDSAVRKWFIRFKSGDTSLEDKEGRGRPSDFDDQALLTAVEEDESLITRVLAEYFNVNQSTIVRRLKKLGKRRVIESIANKGWDLLPHPPYSPTEAPTDYHVNHSLKNWQTNKVYDDLDDSVADVKAWIASKNRDFFARGIDRLPSKWGAVLEVDGDYALE